MQLSKEKARVWLTDRLESVVIKTHNRSESKQFADILDMFCDNSEWIGNCVRRRDIARIGPIRILEDEMLVLKYYSSDNDAKYDGCEIVDFSSFLNEISEESVFTLQIHQR